MYKLIAIDIDGTLINDQWEITKEVDEAIQAARANGVKVVLCSGRPIGGLQSFIHQLKLNKGVEYAITFNGALVQQVSTGEVVSEINLTHLHLKEIYELAQNIGSSMHFYDLERIYTFDRDINPFTVHESFLTKVSLHYRNFEEIPESIHIPKVTFVEEPKRLANIISKIPDSFYEKYQTVYSAPFFWEISHPSVTKGNAVKRLAEYLSIKQEEVICIGDGDNDLSMIEYAGCGVAMGNAVLAVKEIAQFQTSTNNENGVAYAIEKLILNKQ